MMCAMACRISAFGLAALTLGPAVAADLFSATEHRALVGDRRAARQGDIVTILVYENSSASNTADTSTSTSFSVQANVSVLDARRNGAALGASDSYGGRGRIQRTGRLLAQLSAAVVEVMPNGDLRVAGEQRIDVNGEKTGIRLDGRVRATDIGPNNTVISSRLADAHIDYTGDGFITDRAKPGLIPRILAWLGLW